MQIHIHDYMKYLRIMSCVSKLLHACIMYLYEASGGDPNLSRDEYIYTVIQIEIELFSLAIDICIDSWVLLWIINVEHILH